MAAHGKRAHILGPERVELVLDAGAEVGEGPVWDDRRGSLLWLDATAHKVHRLAPTGADIVVADIGEVVGAVALTEGDALVISVDREVVSYDDRSGAVTRLASLTDEADLVVNDAACSPEGNYWAGVASHEDPGRGFVSIVTGRGGVETIRSAMTIPNGIDWSPDQRIIYMVDSPTGRVDAFDYVAPGRLGRRWALAEIDVGDGVPDGLCVDRDGGIWVALWDGWSVRRYLPDGELDLVVRLPVARVTSCAFGGLELRDLYITTAACELSEAQLRAQPAAGGLFRVRVDVPGVEARRVRLQNAR